MHKKLFAAVGILTLFAACSTSKISIRKDVLREMKSVAVMPFTSTVADAKVTRECTELFRGSMLSGGFQVVEREKIDKILKEKELAQSGLVDNKAIEAGQFLGAQGTMLGEITAHEVKSDTIESELPLDGPGKYDPRLDKGDGVFSQREVRPGEKRWYKKDKRDTFQFQIVVRLISNVDGQTVLTLQNEYPVRTYTADSGSLRPANLDQFRAQVLAQMAKDIEKALKEAREP